MFRQPGHNGPARESVKDFLRQVLEQGGTDTADRVRFFFERKAMGLWNALKGIFNLLVKGRGHGVEELARRLAKTVDELRAFQPIYREFVIPKRAGGTRRILAPENELKALQRCILHRLLGRLKCHS